MSHIRDAGREIYKLAVGMYAAAPGVHYYEELYLSLEAGMTITDVYGAVSKTASFQEQTFYLSDLASDGQFTRVFLDTLLGPEVSAAGRAFAENEVLGALTAGMSRGEVMHRAIDALDATAYTDADFGRAAQRLDNRILVAQDRTEVLNVSSTDIAFLQSLVAGVTHDPRTAERTILRNLDSAVADVSVGPASDTLLELNGVPPPDLGF